MQNLRKRIAEAAQNKEETPSEEPTPPSE